MKVLRQLILRVVEVSIATTRASKNPLYVFLAIYNFDFRTSAFKEINRTTQTYAAIVKCYQYALLADVYATQSDASRAAITRWMDRWFRNDTESPLGDILSLWAYAKKLNSLHSNERHQVTKFGRTDLSYKGVRFTQSSLRDFVRGYVIRVTQALSNDLVLRFSVF